MRKCEQPFLAQEDHKRPIRANVCNHCGPKKTSTGPYEDMSATTLVPKRPREAHTKKCLQPLWAQGGHKSPYKKMSATTAGPRTLQEARTRKCLQLFWAQEDHKRPVQENVCNHCGPKKASRGLYEKMSATTLVTRRPQEALRRKCLQPCGAQDGPKRPPTGHVCNHVVPEQGRLF